MLILHSLSGKPGVSIPTNRVIPSDLKFISRSSEAYILRQYRRAQQPAVVVVERVQIAVQWGSYRRFSGRSNLCLTD